MLLSVIGALGFERVVKNLRWVLSPAVFHTKLCEMRSRFSYVMAYDF